ncbi:UNVERIFIED_CONTAM: hypothetical protein HDU68_007362 [Siphonaria sp. JEL0065]|nr:hypothetical protein HDU68_007362 [Siphonaria sp. JEL0065]
MAADLACANSLLDSISLSVVQVKQNRRSLDRLVQRSRSLIQSIATFIQNASVDASASLSFHLETFTVFLQELDDFAKKAGDEKDIIAARILELNNELTMLVNDFSLVIAVDSKDWLVEDQQDREFDKQELEQTLQHLVDNDYKILNALELKQVEYFEAIDALQKQIIDHVDQALEKNLEQIFVNKALTHLRRATNAASRPIKQESPAEWVLTSWEFEVGPVIATGGFGEVLKAKWLGHTTVAIKRLHIRLETAKLREDFFREIRTWYPLRHPNILPLLGACANAERPFMVSPFCERGHALQYLEWASEQYGDLEPYGIKLLYEVSLGMQYLHARGVSHGDLKAVNILVNEHGVACVGDFGFAALKRFTTTKTAAGGGGTPFGGTLRWMSPERLQGAKLSPAVDTYAFAMIVFEVLSEGDVPFTDTPDSLIYQHVVHNNIRPEMPEAPKYPQSRPKAFTLMEQCWAADPLARPPFSMISVTLRTVSGSLIGSDKNQTLIQNAVTTTNPTSAPTATTTTASISTKMDSIETTETSLQTLSISESSGFKGTDEPPFSVEKYFSILPAPTSIPVPPGPPRALPPVPSFIHPDNAGIPQPPPPPPPPFPPHHTHNFPPFPPIPPFPPMPMMASFQHNGPPSVFPPMPPVPSPASIQANGSTLVETPRQSSSYPNSFSPLQNGEKHEIPNSFKQLHFISQGPGTTLITIVRGRVDFGTALLEVTTKKEGGKKGKSSGSQSSLDVQQGADSPESNIRLSYTEGEGEGESGKLEIGVLYPVGGTVVKKKSGIFGVSSHKHDSSTSLRLTIPFDLDTFVVIGEAIDVSYEGTRVLRVFDYNVRRGTLTGNIEGYLDLHAETDSGSLDVRLRPGVPESNNVLRSNSGSVNVFVSGFRGLVKTYCYLGKNSVTGLDPDASGVEKQIFIVGSGAGNGRVGVALDVPSEEIKGKFSSSVTFGSTNISFIRRM